MVYLDLGTNLYRAAANSHLPNKEMRSSANPCSPMAQLWFSLREVARMLGVSRQALGRVLEEEES